MPRRRCAPLRPKACSSPSSWPSAEAPAQAGVGRGKARRRCARVHAPRVRRCGAPAPAGGVKTVAEARPNVDKLEALLAELAQAAQVRAARTARAEAKVVPLRKEAAQLRDGLSEAKLSAATLRERDTYTARIVDARGRDVAAVDAAEDELKNQLARKIVAQRRIAPLLAVFEELTASARRWTHDLEQRAQQAQDSSAGLHAQVTAAREQAKAAHDAYDDVNARLSAARVEKGRLEVRVDAARQLHRAGYGRAA